MFIEEYEDWRGRPTLSRVEKAILENIEDQKECTFTHVALLRMEVFQAGRCSGGAPPANPARKDTADMTLTLGLALVEHSTHGGEKALRFFRIRNHLRQLGLGRRAMACLIAETGVNRDRLFGGTCV